MLTQIGRWFFAFLVLIIPMVGEIPSQADQLTPLIVSPLTAGTEPVLGTDGKLHIVYELVLSDTSPTPATLKKIEVVDASRPSRVLASFEGKELLSHLRTMANTTAESPQIDFDQTRLFLVDMALAANTAMPTRLAHHVFILGAARPGPGAEPVLLSYIVAPFPLSQKVPKIGLPLAGDRWVALNGCCEAGSVHRGSGLPVNGRIYFAQRFAIDWMRLDDKGRMVHGDPADVHNYADYGADILAVADGKVVSTLDTLEDQKPGTLPDPKTINIENVDGNHVVLDLGNGVFAFYAHMQKGSLTVTPGARVKRGQVLGKLGNTGNTSAPHLHFHLMDGPSVLGSSGIPYVFDSFAFAGEISAAKFAATTDLTGRWDEGLLRKPSSRKAEYPMDLSIINFPQ